MGCLGDGIGYFQVRRGCVTAWWLGVKHEGCVGKLGDEKVEVMTICLFAPRCEAEPAVLAEYVLAMLTKEDKNEAELHAYCKDKLEDFLKAATSDFVESLFAAIRSKSYLRNSAQPSVSSRAPLQSESDDEDSDGEHDYKRHDLAI